MAANFLLGWWVIVILFVIILATFKFKGIKHKFLIVFLFFLLLFLYFSFTTVFSKEDVNLNNMSGVIQAGKIYYSWLVHASANFKTIIGNAMHMNWDGNNTLEEFNRGQT